MNNANSVYTNYKNCIGTIYARGEKLAEINEPSFVSNATCWVASIIDGRAILITCAHTLLYNEGTSQPIVYAKTMTCTLSNVYRKCSKTPENITVSIGILGLDVSTDIAVCFTYLPNETDNENFFGFEFSEKNQVLSFGNSAKFKSGDNVYCISNAYGQGLTINNGICSDNDFVYSPNNPLYINQTSQFLSSVDVEEGSSGAPILSGCGKVLGIVAWRKNTGGNYIGGANQKILQLSYEKILSLNPISKITTPYIPINFDGNTGSGWLGLLAYEFMEGQNALRLCEKYHEFAKSQYSKIANGIIITDIASRKKYPLQIPCSRLQNAKNLSGGKKGIKIDDIVLSVNGVDIGYFGGSEQITFSAYYDYKLKVTCRIFRPKTLEFIDFIITPDKYPDSLNYVSTDPTIKLISQGFRWAFPDNYKIKVITNILGNVIYYIYDPFDVLVGTFSPISLALSVPDLNDAKIVAVQYDYSDQIISELYAEPVLAARAYNIDIATYMKYDSTNDSIIS